MTPVAPEKGRKVFNIQHRCYYFSRDVIEFVCKSRYPKVCHSLFHQLVRCATSIGANVVEAKAGSSKKDWKHYHLIALKSANETKYWLCLIRDILKSEKVIIDRLLKEAIEISKIMASMAMSS